MDTLCGYIYADTYTPAIIGTSDTHSNADGIPMPMRTPINTDTKGSADLTTLAKATEPAPRDMTVA